MHTFIHNLTHNWHFARWLRTVFSIVLFIIYLFEGDSFALMLGMIFGFQAIFNMGCFGSTSCSVPHQNPESQGSVDRRKIEYTEIKRKD